MISRLRGAREARRGRGLPPAPSRWNRPSRAPPGTAAAAGVIAALPRGASCHPRARSTPRGAAEAPPPVLTLPPVPVRCCRRFRFRRLQSCTSARRATCHRGSALVHCHPCRPAAWPPSSPPLPAVAPPRCRCRRVFVIRRLVEGTDARQRGDQAEPNIETQSSLRALGAAKRREAARNRALRKTARRSSHYSDTFKSARVTEGPKAAARVAAWHKLPVQAVGCRSRQRSPV